MMKFEYHLEIPKDLDAKVADKCFICGRNEVELQGLLNAQNIEIDTQITRLEAAIDELTKNYNASIEEVLKSTKESKLLDLPLKTIINDLGTFKTKIPHLEDILKPVFWENYLFNSASMEMKYGGKPLEYFWSLFKENMVGNPDNCPEIVDLKKSIEELRKKQMYFRNFNGKKDYNLGLMKKKIYPIDGSFEMEITICTICSWIVPRQLTSMHKIGLK